MSGWTWRRVRGGSYAAGWKTSLTHLNDDAVWWDAAAGMWKELRDPNNPLQSVDLAFAIVPEPSTAALALVGGACVCS